MYRKTRPVSFWFTPFFPFFFRLTNRRPGPQIIKTPTLRSFCNDVSKLSEHDKMWKSMIDFRIHAPLNITCLSHIWNHCQDWRKSAHLNSDTDFVPRLFILFRFLFIYFLPSFESVVRPHVFSCLRLWRALILIHRINLFLTSL